MNNFDLNMAIAQALGIYSGFDHASISEEGVKLINNDTADYCNNWDDLMSEIEKINVDHEMTESASGWRAILSYSDKGWESTAKSQKRAYAECLYKVLESKND